MADQWIGDEIPIFCKPTGYKMKRLTRWLHIAASWILTICLPPMLLITSILLLMNPVFLNLEYRRPGFPPDVYGFTLAERLKYSQVSVAYLLDRNQIDFLRNQLLPDGNNLYNERELSHMVDVKNVVQGTLHGWLVGWVILILLTIWAFRGGWKHEYWSAIRRGGALTVGVILLVLVSVVVNFDQLFTLFHKVFFESGTWVFYYSDSLIRLFPLPFWQDCFIITGSLSLFGGILLGVVGHRQYLTHN
jgi:integral membrane protein (TIGR01906 family)